MPLLDDLIDLGHRHGLHRVGVAPAERLERARQALLERREQGLHDGMQFTYRNPDRSTDPERSVQGARSIVVGARSYLLDPPDRPPGAQARVGRYAWVDHYEPLRYALWVIADHLRSLGHRAVVFADDNSVVDREVAWRAGIGWFGKNANLLVPGAGSWFVLGCVITSADLPASSPVDDGCGSCRRCLDGCPTGAIVAPGVIDAGRCLAWLLQKPGLIAREHRVAVGDRIYGCDDCQEVCPPTIRFGASVPAPTAASGDEGVQAWVPVVELLRSSDDEILQRYGRWYLAGREPRWLRRNALVVLGNVGEPRSSAVTAVLRRYLGDPDPMLRAHAVWAAARLGRHDLVPASDPEPLVAAELAALGEVRSRGS